MFIVGKSIIYFEDFAMISLNILFGRIVLETNMEPSFISLYKNIGYLLCTHSIFSYFSRY